MWFELRFLSVSENPGCLNQLLHQFHYENFNDITDFKQNIITEGFRMYQQKFCSKNNNNKKNKFSRPKNAKNYFLKTFLSSYLFKFVTNLQDE